MKLTLGWCYAVQLANGSVVKSRFVGENASGVVEAEVPPGGNRQDLIQILAGGRTAFWDIDRNNP